MMSFYGDAADFVFADFQVTSHHHTLTPELLTPNSVPPTPSLEILTLPNPKP